MEIDLADARLSNPFTEVVRSAVSSYFRLRHDKLPTSLWRDPDKQLTAFAVEFEVARFKVNQGAEVDPKVDELLTEYVHHFAFEPSDSWNIDPVLHSDYTVSLILGIPVGLKSVQRTAEKTKYIRRHETEEWLVNNVTFICPYICPGSYDG